MSASLALQELRQGNLQVALQMAEAGLAQFLETTPSDAYWQFLCVKAEALRQLGRPAEALCCLEVSEEDRLSPGIGALLKMHRGYLSGFLGRYTEARMLLSNALQLAQKDDLLTTEVRLRMAMVAFLSKNYEDSRQQYTAALEVATARGDRYLQTLALAGLAKNEMIRGRYKEAIAGFEQALAMSLADSTRLLTAALWSELGWCHLNLGDDEKALQFFLDAERVLRESGAQGNYQICLGNIGNVYDRREDYPTAIAYYQRALEIARRLGDPVSCAKWLRNLARTFSRMGNPVAGASFQKQAAEIAKSLDEECAKAARVVQSRAI